MVSVEFKYGDLVEWTHLHLCGHSPRFITKSGIFLGLCQHREPCNVQLARVRFSGDLAVSCVPLTKLEKCSVKHSS